MRLKYPQKLRFLELEESYKKDGFIKEEYITDFVMRSGEIVPLSLHIFTKETKNER